MFPSCSYSSSFDYHQQHTTAPRYVWTDLLSKLGFLCISSCLWLKRDRITSNYVIWRDNRFEMTEWHYLISSGRTIDTKGTEAVSSLRTTICQPVTDSSCLALELMFEKKSQRLLWSTGVRKTNIHSHDIYIYVVCSTWVARCAQKTKWILGAKSWLAKRSRICVIVRCKCKVR